jgi:transcription elongation factor SPT4
LFFRPPLSFSEADLDMFLDKEAQTQRQRLWSPARALSLAFDAVFVAALSTPQKTQPLLLLIPLPLPTPKQFTDTGCENCGFLGLRGRRDRVDTCTTVEFSGVVSVLQPGASWCAKWLRVEHAVPGCYAISVRPPVETLPDDVIEKLEQRGIDWRGEGR